MKIKNIDISNTVAIPTLNEAKYLRCEECIYFFEGMCYAKSVAAGIILTASCYSDTAKPGHFPKRQICSFVKNFHTDYSFDEIDVIIPEFK